MLVRMAGCDADMEFSEDLLEMIAAIEKAFPAPEYSVMFADAQDEEEDDTLTISKRYSGVLIPMVYVTVDELDELQAEGVDWVAQIASDLSRTQEQIEAEIDAADAEESE